MKALIVLATLALLPGCATSGAQVVPTREWLVGIWLAQKQGERSLLACASGLPIAYRADGTYGTWEWDGIWRLDGDRLIETATIDNEMIPPEEVPLGTNHVSRIVRVADDEMLQIHPNGTRVTHLRCPEPE